MKTRTLVIIGMVLAAVASRLLPHPPNFTPIAAIALFGGACFSKRWVTLLVTFGAMLLSDWIIGFHSQLLTVYFSFLLVLVVGLKLRNHRRPFPILGGTLAGSFLFFLITNFGVWMWDGMYPKTVVGLVACYLAAIPFFGNTIMGDLFYSTLLFGGLFLIESKFVRVREASSPAL